MSNGRNFRLLSLAHSALTSYSDGRSSLRELVNTLDAVWSQLEMPEAWMNDFRSEWLTLETVLAVTSDDPPRRRDEEMERIVVESISALSSLIRLEES